MATADLTDSPDSPDPRDPTDPPDAPGPELRRFAEGLSFGLDDFQLRACTALEDGHGVLVCAPTGAGKTVVGEFAVHLALRGGSKCFYTTPIKALSNQKYNDLCDKYGSDVIGLLTGDNAINSSAPIVVMTTEVLRNMIYAGSPTLLDLSHVVMDEVHFLADRFRGAVWEEVILHLDPDVRVVSLSATVSNAEEFGDWMSTVRGDTAVIVDEHRPVPLTQHMLVGSRIFELFGRAKDGGRRPVNPELVRYIRQRVLLDDDDHRVGRTGYRGGRDRGRRGNRRAAAPSRPRLIAALDDEGMLPAIDFIFSRNGCDAALAQCRASSLTLLEADQIAEVDEIVDRHLTGLTEDDAEVLGVAEWRAALRRGFASHHAGLLPAFREAVEELFVKGLVKMVFATETLALGINMPARSVVLERLVKFNGEAHVDLTPGEFTQLTGRAGRRGIDTHGHAIVVWSPELVPEEVAGLAGARTFALRSSFSPEYNMAVNLIDRLGLEGSRHLLRRSFAQFQADRSVVGQARQLDRARAAVAEAEAELVRLADGSDVVTGLTEAENSGDRYAGFIGYTRLRDDIRIRERDLKLARRVAGNDAIAADLEALKKGQVIGLYSGRHRGVAVVVAPADRLGDPRPVVLGEDAWCGRVSVRDFLNPPEVLGHMRLPKRPDTRTGRARRDLASALRATGIELPKGRHRRHRPPAAEDQELDRLKARLRSHPAHGLAGAEALFRAAEKQHRLAREVTSLERSMRARTSGLETTFDAVVAVLTELNYLEELEDGEVRVTPTGEVLSRIYSETDLLVTECIRAGVWDRLTAPQLAALVASVLYESRGDSFASVDTAPSNPVSREAMAQTLAIWERITGLERRHGLTETREPDTGFSGAIAAWTAGRPLAEALAAAGERGRPLPAGDFVRWSRQVVDLLEQIRGSVDPSSPLAARARQASKGIRRGVVAAELG